MITIIAGGAGCSKAPDRTRSESSYARPKCDPFELLDCENDGPRGQLICTCVPSGNYDCDPTKPSADTCEGNQPMKCGPDGHWTADGAPCPTGTLCHDQGECVTPPLSPAQLTSWDGLTPPGFGMGALVKVNKVAPSNGSWQFQYAYQGSFTGEIFYQLTLFAPSPTDPQPYGLVDSGSLGISPPYHTVQFTFDLTRYPLLPDPSQLWLRVVVIDTNGATLAISNAEHISYGTFVAPVLHLGPQHPNIPTVQLQKVGVPDENWQYWFTATKDIVDPISGQTIWHNGTDYYVPPKSKSWLEDAGSFFTDALSWLADAWNWIAHAYGSLKSGIIDAAVGALNDIGVSCDAVCKSALNAGLDYGLAACGLPPSLPDVDELINDGQDWVADQIADASGVDPQITRVVVQKTVDAMKAAKENGGNGAAWLKPAPSKQYHPGVLFVTLQNPSSSEAIPRGSLTLTDTLAFIQVGSQPLPRFQPITVTYSKIPANGSVTIPVALTPSVPSTWFQDRFNACLQSQGVAGLVDCENMRDIDWQTWKAWYSVGSVPFDVVTTREGFGGAGAPVVDHGTINVDLSSALPVPTYW